ncbi:MAG TPA: phenylalanine--tRNA ligase subunit beta [archaeon]|nr:phenylalanine--tRNA ligase subunit beta [archaeon]
MPKIEVSQKDLCGLIGRKLSVEQLRDEVMYAKGELDEVNGDLLKLDMKDTNRPDTWSAEGVAREIKARYKPSGLPKYILKKSKFVVHVDKSTEKVTPYVSGSGRLQTVCAVVKGLKINEAVLSQIIQLQEKVGGTLGRNRKEVSIGVYDLHKIKFPVTFRAIGPREIKFVPLGLADKMTPQEILEKHPKGKEYGHLLANQAVYPLFIDSAKEVLSMPPIINSNHSGRVTEHTKDVFIECSGFDNKLLNTALDVLVAALYDRGGTVYSVKVKYGNKTTNTPDFAPKKFYVNTDYIRKIAGIELADKQIIDLLRKSLYDAKIKGKRIELLYPAYRQDIMHERDIVEDVLISYGFNNMEPVVPHINTKGGVAKTHIIAKRIARIMAGAGFQEVMSYTLTNRENLYDKMQTSGDLIEIENPMSSNWSVFRTSLLPGLLEFFTDNMHHEYPQMVFEIGNTLATADTETRTKDVDKIAGAITATEVNYEMISSYLDALMRNLGIQYKLQKSSHKSFIEGRTAEIIVNGKPVGFIGEMHPNVLNNWRLEKPVVAFEINLGEIFE